MAAYSIGPFSFFSLSAPPGALSQRKVVEVRAGADGVAIYDTGKRGAPFVTISVVDVLSVVNANQLFRQYLILKEPGEPVDVVWAGYNPPVKTKYDVLEIEILDAHKNIASVGGLFGFQSVLACSWTLLPVEI